MAREKLTKKVMEFLKHLKLLQNLKITIRILCRIKKQIIMLQHSKILNTNVSRVNSSKPKLGELFVELITHELLCHKKKSLVFPLPPIAITCPI
jgi:hypothetical protein